MNEFKLYSGNELKKIKRLSKIETNDLFKNNSRDSMEKIFEGNLFIVLYVIKKKFYKCQDKEDLFQVGCIGLWRSILNFDITLGYSFSNYAFSLIEGEIKRYIRDNNLVKISQSKIDLYYKISKLQEVYSRKNGGQSLSTLELSKLLTVPISQIEDALLLNNNICSIDEKINTKTDKDDLYLKDYIYNPDYKIYEEVEYKELLALINEIIERFSNRDKIIIRNFLKLDSSSKTQTQIANEFGLSQSGISRIIKRFKNMLKDEIDYKPNKKTSLKENVKVKSGNIDSTIYESLPFYDKDQMDFGGLDDVFYKDDEETVAKKLTL